MKKIAFVVTTPSTINAFMLDHINSLAKEYSVYVIANKELSDIKFGLPIKFIDLALSRKISLFDDLMAIIKLTSIIRKEKFDVVHSITPKAGLIGMIASYLSRTSNRFHTFTGQVWVTKTGCFRALLKLIDKLIFELTTFSLVDSSSQRKFLLQEGVVSVAKSRVLGNGSISGVDIKRFRFSSNDRSDVRTKFAIPQDAFVFLFLGRLCIDKGINELIEAFDKLEKDRNYYLLLVGPNESNFDEHYINRLGNCNIKLCGSTNKPESYFSASDALVLPSYREGFGTVVIEAAACGIPTLASNIYGLSDAIDDGITGLLHEVKNVSELSEHMERLASDRELSRKFGDNAKIRVENSFSSDYVSDELVKFYKENVDA